MSWVAISFIFSVLAAVVCLVVVLRKGKQSNEQPFAELTDQLNAELESMGFADGLDRNNKIVGEYLLGAVSQNEGLKDQRLLPYPKDDLDKAVWVAYLVEDDADKRDVLSAAYVELSNYQQMSDVELEACLYITHLLALRDLPIEANSLLKMNDAKDLIEPIRSRADAEMILRQNKLDGKAVENV